MRDMIATPANGPQHYDEGKAVEEETTPNISSMSDQELRELIDKLTAEEQEVSYRRRILHGQIDLLRAELVNRLRDDHSDAESLIKGDDVERLSQILVRQHRAAHQAPELGRSEQAWQSTVPSAGS